MKIKVMMLLPIVFAVSACATDGRPASQAELAMASAGCSEGNLKFHIGDAYLRVTPHDKCVEQGTTYIASIVQHGNYEAVAGDINIAGAVTWLDKSNTGNKLQVVIVVPADAATGPEKYELLVDGVGTLDPVVRVRTKGAQ